MNPDALRAAAEARYPAFIARLAELVAVDSGSRQVAGLHQVATLLSGYAENAGLSVRRHPVTGPDGEPLGDAVVARMRGTGTRRILLAAHLDTVFPAGTAQARPFTVDTTTGRAHGPGVSDDKGGLLAGLAAVEVLAATGSLSCGELILIATPDEEIGSIGSRELLTGLATGADAVLCLECARDNGDLVTARKGVADIEIDLIGRAAHAGIEPERGANAALAAAHLTVALQQLNGSAPDLTVNVGVLRAGTRPNVVAERAHLVVDLRAADPAVFDAALAEISTLARLPVVTGVAGSMRIVAPAPPWSGGAGTDRLLLAAERVGAALGLTVTHAATGGCADANLLAANGAPVLDGLGPVGGGDHGPDEWLDLSSVVPRVALLAGLIEVVAAS
ncbi:glutamate carboxypeptidase [Allocatelliglobosispora scoriae]|uniref:Glutamate carboxypeptidase n=1 Tax=Allocatelliglobosispora scoriae TaxID=643052 RepID=A0A841BEB3_9ACTN|nr:M20/M25/M40 family metallo-hydrolase [Allocatelliglobosispora scoriae]MBB5867427.1 glutamate carboxypeptidase [Allocatelliglobosispora scoriae]